VTRDAEATDRARGADAIAAEVRRRAAAAGIVPIGVTWDHGVQLAAKPSHRLELFRGNAYATAIFSDAELTHFPDRLTVARTAVKLNALVNDLVRRLSVARVVTAAPGATKHDR